LIFSCGCPGEWTLGVDKTGIVWYNKIKVQGVNIMRKATVDENKKCPKCGKIDQQVKVGFNDSGTQRCKCKICGIRYTLDPKRVAYPE